MNAWLRGALLPWLFCAAGLQAAPTAQDYLRDAQAALADNAIEAAEEAVEAGLRLEADPALQQALLNQGAALRLMRSDWLGAYALLLEAERRLPAGKRLSLEGELNLLNALWSLPESWDKDLRLASSEGGPSGVRGAVARSLASGAYLRRAQLSLRRLAREEAVEARLNALDDRFGTTGAVSAALWLSYAELLGRFAEAASGEARSELDARSLRALERADELGRRAGDERLRSFAQGLRGELLERRGDLPGAETHYAVALLLAQRSGAQEARYRWRWRLGALALGQGDLSTAERHLAQAVTLLGEVRGRLPARSTLVFQRTMLPVYEAYVDVLLRRAARSTGAEAQGLLAEVQATLEAQKTAEVEDYFARQCVTAEEGSSGLAPGLAALYPILLEDRLVLLLLRDSAYQTVSVPVPRAELEPVAEAFRLALEQGEDPRAGRREGEALYRWLLKPLEAEGALAGIQTVLLVPDGVLRTVPFAALFDGERYLLERYAFVTTPALSLTDRRSEARGEGPSLLVGGLSDAVQGFAPLPGVAREVALLDDRFNAEVVFNTQFSETAVRDRFDRSSFAIAHFATHGTFESDHRQSFLLTYEDVLSLGALERLLGQEGRPPLELLMLSACQTAAGDERAALGLAGVAIQAGARSAVASLWFISDAATAELVANFYDGFLEGGLSKAEALRQAQLQLLRQDRFAAPSYWAPYLLVGANQ